MHDGERYFDITIQYSSNSAELEDAVPSQLGIVFYGYNEDEKTILVEMLEFRIAAEKSAS